MYSNKLELSNYFIVDSTDSKQREEIDGAELRCRGMIFKNDNDVQSVASTFPYTEEYSINNIDVVDHLVNEGDWNFFYSYEGTVIRIIHDEQDGVIKRLVCTHKKLDAFESYWGSNESYGEIFKKEIGRMFLSKFTDSLTEKDEIFNSFLDSLDTSKHYTFLLTSNEDNKIVSSHDNKILFIGAFDRETNKYVSHLDCDKNTYSSFLEFDVPEQVNISNCQDIINFVNKIDYKYHQGLIAIRKDKFELFKVINELYKLKSLLRGNNSNLVFRYLQLRSLGETDMLDNFLELFSSNNIVISNVEQDLVNLSIYIHHVYYKRYIQKNFVFVSPVFHSILKSIHNWHYQDKKKNITTLEVVSRRLKDVDCKSLFYMLKEWSKIKEESQQVLF